MMCSRYLIPSWRARCGCARARLGSCIVWKDGRLVAVAHQNFTPEALAIERRVYPAAPEASGLIGLAVLDRTVVHSTDYANDPRTAHPPIGQRLASTSFSRFPCCVTALPLEPLVLLVRQSLSRTDRFNSWRRSPTKPSLPSRTCGCSTSCANPYSSRPPPPTCSRSSAARPSISRRCSIRWPSRPCDCARGIDQSSLGPSAIPTPSP